MPRKIIMLVRITKAVHTDSNDICFFEIAKPFDKINPYLKNGFTHHYQLDESTCTFRGVRSDFYFYLIFSIKFLCANKIAPDGTPRSAASHLGLFCLPMSHKRDARLK